MEILVRKIVIPFGKTLILLASISLAFCITSCKSEKQKQVPYYNDASFTPLWDLSFEEKTKLHKTASFNFTNQFDEKITRETVRGKICLVSFFFTSCPSICPKLINTMRLVFENFKQRNDVVFLSHSVTPEIDSVDRLYQYAKKNRILSKQWHLLTGNKSEIYNIARKSYFIEEEPGLIKLDRQFLHTENFVLIDQDGHIRGLYNGTLESEVPRIIEDINILLN